MIMRLSLYGGCGGLTPPSLHSIGRCAPSLLLLVVVVVGGVAGDDLGGDVVVVCLDVHVGPLLALPLL